MSAAVDLSTIRTILLEETYLATLLGKQDDTARAALTAGQELEPVRVFGPIPHLVALHRDGVCVGRLPAEASEVPANLMLAGKTIAVRVSETGEFRGKLIVQIHVFLRD